jgi:hypothetical protein
MPTVGQSRVRLPNLETSLQLPALLLRKFYHEFHGMSSSEMSHEIRDAL